MTAYFSSRTAKEHKPKLPVLRPAKSIKAADFSKKRLKPVILIAESAFDEESLDCSVGHINVNLRNNLERCMHREHRNTDIENINIVSCNGQRNCSAAACINASKLVYLPENIVAVKNGTNLSDKLCRSV